MTQSWLWTILSCPRYYKCKLILTWNYILNAADLEIFLTFPQGALTCSWSTIPRRVLQTPSGWILLFIEYSVSWIHENHCGERFDKCALHSLEVSSLPDPRRKYKYKCLLSMFLFIQTHAAYEGVKRSGVDQTARNHNGRWLFSIYLNFPFISSAFAMPSNYMLPSRRIFSF